MMVLTEHFFKQQRVFFFISVFVILLIYLLYLPFCQLQPDPPAIVQSDQMG